MSDSFSSTFFHLVFSTKHRERLIRREFERDVWKYFGGIARNLECEAVQTGGVEDHLHSLLRIPPKFAPSEIIKKPKSNSSRFIRREFCADDDFRWQDGFGLFSVSKSVVPDVVRDIRDQRKHHGRLSFEDEFRQLLKLHDLEETSYIFD